MTIDEFISILNKSDVLHKNFYHFTDVRNLPLIKTHGILSAYSLATDGISVPAPGGNQWSQEADQKCGMDRYAHLCFRQEHPMEFLAKQDGRIERSIFLEVSPNILKLPGVLITNGVSNKSGVRREQADKMLNEIDLEVIYCRTDWKDSAIKERLKLATKLEVLVPDRISPNFILNL